VDGIALKSKIVDCLGALVRPPILLYDAAEVELPLPVAVWLDLRVSEPYRRNSGKDPQVLSGPDLSTVRHQGIGLGNLRPLKLRKSAPKVAKKWLTKIDLGLIYEIGVSRSISTICLAWIRTMTK
jgi:hypothetical protein